MQLNFLDLMLNASIVQQFVLGVLILMSISSWIVIFNHIILVKRARNILLEFEEIFWSGVDLNKFYRLRKDTINVHSGIENVFSAGFKEFSRLSKTSSNTDVMIESVQRTMRIAVTREEELLERNLSLLASIGSVSPYIGLFGTVAGIINAFLAMSITDQVTLQQIAPGIAEALIATAVGLFAAIPAVWAYNYLTSKVEILLTSYSVFSDEFASVLNRKIRQ